MPDAVWALTTPVVRSYIKCFSRHMQRTMVGTVAMTDVAIIVSYAMRF